MSKVISLLFIILPVALLAQKKSALPQYKQQANKQMRDAMSQIDELEKKDPETGRMIRQMMNKGQQKTSVPIHSGNPTIYTSSIKKIPIKASIPIPTAKQATDRLLWYKGKKLNDNTLITTKGNLVQFNKKTNQLVVQPQNSKDPFSKIDKELSKTEERKNELIKQWSSVKNSFFFYPAIKSSLAEMDRITESYKKIIKNTFDIPPVSSSTTNSNPTVLNKGPNISEDDELTDIPPEIKQLYNQVMDEIQHLPSLDFPPPPQQQFDACYTCDDNAQKEYEEKKDDWVNNQFWKFESSINYRAVSVVRSLIDSKDSEAGKMVQDMANAMKIASDRMEEKTNRLTDNYLNDFPNIPVIIETNLSLERKKQLLGLDDGQFPVRMQKIASVMNGFDAYLTHQMDIKNYNVVFNFPVILSMERRKLLLGIAEDDKSNYLDRVMAFNRFRLALEISFNITSEDLIADGNMKSKEDFFVSLGLVNCKYQLFITKTNYRNAEEIQYYIPMNVISGTKKVHENDKWTTYPYSGPKDMYALFPPFRISFCDAGEDSVFLDILRYDAKAMNNPNVKALEHSYGIDFLGYSSMLFFNDASVLKVKTPAEMNLGEQMKQLVLGSIVIEPTGNPILDKMQQDYETVKKMQDLQYKMFGLTLQNKLLILFDAHNNATELINVTRELTHKIQEEMNVSGKINIQVLHDPLPYAHSLRNP